MPFTVTELALPGVLLIEPQVFRDARGFFMETFKRSDYEAAGLPGAFVQENHSRSIRSTLRGLHFQRPPRAQAKLVRVVVGEIFDVAVDIRPDSPTFGGWVGVTLSADNHRMLYVPSWCAHGLCVTSDEAEVDYKTTAEYAPELEDGILWNDPALDIAWPTRAPLLADRDRHWPLLAPRGSVTTRRTVA
jgi:dTDP-4-dehydrorhamnose 3,5-epimerase